MHTCTKQAQASLLLNLNDSEALCIRTVERLPNHPKEAVVRVWELHTKGEPERRVWGAWLNHQAPGRLWAGRAGRGPGRGKRATGAPGPRAGWARHTSSQRPAWLSAATGSRAPSHGVFAGLKRRPGADLGAVVWEPARGCGCAEIRIAEQDPGTRGSAPARASSGPRRRVREPEVSFGLWRHSPWELGQSVWGVVPRDSQRHSEDISTRGLCLGKGGCISGPREKDQELSAPPGTQQRVCYLAWQLDNLLLFPPQGHADGVGISGPWVPSTADLRALTWALAKFACPGPTFSLFRSPAGAAFPHAPPAAAQPWTPLFRSSAGIWAPPAPRAPARFPTTSAGTLAGPSRTATVARAPRTRH